MEIVKSVLIGVYVVVCGALIVLAMIQTKEGASETIVGGNSSNFYEKNKGKTREGRMKKWTIILAGVFAILSIGLGILIYAFPGEQTDNVGEEDYINEIVDENSEEVPEGNDDEPDETNEVSE